ncbi:hypothetical protein N8T08_007499 [Aspergillus melleus]|uniref:Uncharacterized protein n=1 Tax=Aspergillus melleus TaxID=138277 RepID=A0ACC3AXD7_9EURO|nr:hypothetical protein N8T08_007499 [Aspergillus melleus]
MPENHPDNANANAHYPYDTNRVRELLKGHRKTRGLRSCFPCRHRKVRCDGLAPCSSCVKRGHRDLCRFPTERGRSAGAGPVGTGTASSLGSGSGNGVWGGGLDLDVITHSIEESQSQAQQPSTDPNLVITRLEKIEEQISALKAELRASSVTAPPLQSSDHGPGTSNQSSLLRSRPPSKSPGRYCIEDATGATLYLGSHSDTPLALGCRQASDRGDFLLHEAMANQFVPRAYPFTSLWGPEATTADICETLPEDADMIREGGESSEDEPNTSWLALLFAVLACGVQFSDDPIRQRDLRSKVFGSTIRLAQSIGLHDPSRSLLADEQIKQNQLWWMIIWQDIFLSFTYDRPPSLIPIDISLSSDSMDQRASDFQHCVLDLCRIISIRAQNKTPSDPRELLQNTLQYKQQIEKVLDHAQPFLVDRSQCTSFQNHLERLALGIHFGYSICRLCQIYVDDTDSNLPIPVAIESGWSDRAMQVVECFLDLHRLSASVCRSLAFVHNSVSCAITLMSHERLRPADDRKMRSLIERMIAVLEKEEKNSEWRDADTNVRYFGPYSRALKALREISSSHEGVANQF